MTSQLLHSDLQPFGSLKKHLASKRFVTDADVKQAVTSSLQTLDTYLFYVGTQVLVPRWVRYWNVSVACREVWCVPSATVCHVHIEIRIRFSASERELHYFETPLSISQKVQQTKQNF